MNRGVTHKEFDNSTGTQVNSVQRGVAFKSMLDISKNEVKHDQSI